MKGIVKVLNAISSNFLLVIIGFPRSWPDSPPASVIPGDDGQNGNDRNKMGGGNEMRRGKEKGETRATKVMRMGTFEREVIADNRVGTKVLRGKQDETMARWKDQRERNEKKVYATGVK